MTNVSDAVLDMEDAEVSLEELTRLAGKTEFGKSGIGTAPTAWPTPAVMIGLLAGFGEAGAPLVTIVQNAEAGLVTARSTVELTGDQIGSEVALVFEQGDLTKPIILGCMRPQTVGRLGVTMDGKQLTLSAEQEIVLSCGKSSIRLTRAGKVIICGAYLLSRSSGVNRIKGGSVQIN